MSWRRRARTIHVAVLDRQMAEADAIRRAVASGARSVRVYSSERIVDPAAGNAVWEVVLTMARAAGRLPGQP